MPPIRIHSEAPINESIPAATETTQAVAPIDSSQQAPTPTTSTTAYPAARPGAPAVPAPTGLPTAAAARYAPPQATRTTDLDASAAAPPLPQPGAIPQPPPTTSFPGGTAPRDTLPPPPQPGQTPQTVPSNAYAPPPALAGANTAQPRPLPVQTPVQLGYAPPTLNAAPTHSTDTAHPPGYQQNPYAGDMTPEQRALLQAKEKEASVGGGGNFLESVTGWIGGNSSGADAGAGGLKTQGRGNTNTSGSGGLGTGGEGTAVNEMLEGAKKWIGGVGEKMGQMEEEVWKRINKN